MNKVNILSNKLDQAPKTKENGYQERLDEMKDVIYKAFDQFDQYVDSDEIITNRIKKNQSELPLDHLNELKDGETLAIELKRDNLDEKPGERNKAPGFPKFLEDTIFSKLENIKVKPGRTELQPGEKTTILIIQKKVTDPKFPENKDFKTKIIEFALPGENTLLLEEMVFEKELTGKEFEDIIDTLDVKNPKDREE
ncbi:MAG: hypothetical protein HG456_002205 [candidate division SR1 bacterium]|nr:hypothetical protein [candidate division SR1 bacterium]